MSKKEGDVAAKIVRDIGLTGVNGRGHQFGGLAGVKKPRGKGEGILLLVSCYGLEKFLYG